MDDIPLDTEPENSPSPGFYGKLPAHGDFVQRNLPLEFVEPWDEWLQLSISASKEALQDDWLETYLTSPIWHFLLSPGLINEYGWLGIVLPSVDSVGRYFPFTIAFQLPEDSALSSAFYGNNDWFHALEELALSALEQRLEAEAINQSLAAMTLSIPSKSAPEPSPMGWLYNVQGDDYLPTASSVLDSLLLDKYQRFSVWRTAGSPKVAACTRVAAQLPDKHQYISMLDSSWIDIPLL